MIFVKTLNPYVYAYNYRRFADKVASARRFLVEKSCFRLSIVLFIGRMVADHRQFRFNLSKNSSKNFHI